MVGVIAEDAEGDDAVDGDDGFEGAGVEGWRRGGASDGKSRGGVVGVMMVMVLGLGD